MNIKNIAQYTSMIVYLFLAMAYSSFSSAERNGIIYSNYNNPNSVEVASAKNYFNYEPTCQTEEKKSGFTFSKKSNTNEEHIGSFFYRAIYDPNKVKNQIAVTAILYGLDTVGLGDNVREGIYFIKRNTHYSFGDCGSLQFTTSKISTGSCLSGEGSVELNSTYNFNSVQLQFLRSEQIVSPPQE